MEFALIRAMEVNRLSLGQLESLQAKEDGLGRCLMPDEVKGMFKIQGLKEVHGIPESDGAQYRHNLRLRDDFRKAGIYPKYFYLSPRELDDVHEFDKRIALSTIDFSCRERVTSKKRLRDDLGI